MHPLEPPWDSANYFSHQEMGIRWMLHLEEKGFPVPDTEIILYGGILGDKPGVGKTIQALGLIMNSPAQNTLIVTPLSIKSQWLQDLIKCKVNVYTPQEWGGKWVSQKPTLFKKSVYLAHYDKLSSKPSLTSQQSFDRIILDEAHIIKNTQTKKCQAILKINTAYTWILTGTPVPNRMTEAITYLQLLKFPISSRQWLPVYETCIRNMYLSRIQQECSLPVGFHLPPPPMEETILLDFTNPQEETLYTSILRNEEFKWRRAINEGNKLELLSIYMRLRQISINPQIYTNARQAEPAGWTGPTFSGPSRKFIEVGDLLSSAFQAKESRRWIIFCQFRNEITLLTQFLKQLDFIGTILSYHGGMSIRERDTTIEASKVRSTHNKQDVFLIQLQAGSTGLNLQHYDRIIFMSPWWTPSEIEQAKCRAVRIGQTETVKIFHLILKAESFFNIESFMLSKILEKQELSEEFESWSVHRKV